MRHIALHKILIYSVTSSYRIWKDLDQHTTDISLR